MKNEIIPAVLLVSLSLTCLALVLAEVRKTLRKTPYDQPKQRIMFAIILVSVILWVALLAGLSLNGFFAHFDSLPPRPVFAILTPLPFVIFFAFSRPGTLMIRQVSPEKLVMMQGFRIVVEILILVAFLRGLFPKQMTFEGENLDIITGVLALPVGYYCFVRKSWPPSVAIAYNFIGLLLLLNILIIAVLSMPGPWRFFMNEPANSIVAHFPFIYLPGLLVPLAYSMHIFSLRQLLGGRK